MAQQKSKAVLVN